ncbi:MAG TPA: phosphate ABC transporter substrate-binding protein PstS [Chthoniobacterales bacterium]|jgi:phosphate transport system substrate-binding protein|nr:phosphate ABC transporter substrate-binding protein PstS [Chthoniobacterales bacterium]
MSPTTFSIFRPVFSAVAFALSLTALAPTQVQAGDVTLVERGSTLLYPLFNIWIENYTKTHPGVNITANATGSEDGIKKALSGEVQIGASDVFMSDKVVKENPQMLNIPLCISAQMINYNLPGLDSEKLKLDGTVLAGIYSGKIRDWDAAPIVALNPGLKLPHQTIIPIRRADGSGDTFIFTQFLAFSDTTWADNCGYGTTISWPAVPGSLEATGNEGMVETAQKTPYSVAYIGVSYSAQIANAGLGTAWIGNQSGNFLLPTKESVQAAAAGLGSRTPPDERLDIAFAPGEDAYPLINYEYAIVSAKQADPATAAAIRKFLLWTIVPSETNESYLDSVHFIALPPHVWELSQAQIQNIK